MKITLNDTEIFFHVQYSKRKKMTLEATAEGHITVKAPSKSTEEDIMAFMRANNKVLVDFQKRLENRKFISSQKKYNEDENFLYLGKACTLGDLLEVIPETEEEIQMALKKFYTTKTKEIIKKRVKHFEKVIGVKAKSMMIVDSPKSWGTCNGLKELTFNYRLSMAPLNVIDYVVIHELCHILHLNHDRSFWRKVGAFDPNYEAHQNYLARFNGVMTI
ncbi:M48 family metallopeptidase [Cellulosilyticum ruminicola]|uniref:M48 family metallopeptidase n=1 Tax=Cellulosilyticum ruminicola TaxID=425254 RepID=UPI0006CFA63B|nr:YgjP-like metallopeptidase domain-containing protein [Cellulosilyticum ruminicola]